MTPVEISHIEWHLAHSCNLTCYGCGHFSNHAHTGIVSYDTLETWYKSWHKKILPRCINLLGGEPLLNKDIYRILDLTRRYWNNPSTKIVLLTNGLLLPKFLELPLYLTANNVELHISKHSNSSDYLNKLQASIDLAVEWQKTYNIKFEIVHSDINWWEIYKGYGKNMMPYEDNDIEQSWNNCITGQDCFQLFENKIYKCSPLAYLQIQKKIYSLSPKWDYYLTYKPLEDNCSQEQIVDFFNRKAESFCGMCPKNPRKIPHSDPMILRSEYERHNK